MLKLKNIPNLNSEPVAKTIDSVFNKHGIQSENFLSILTDSEAVNQINSAHDNFKSKKTLIQVGLGGSSLGPEMIYDAFKLETSKQLIFFNNSDPYYIEKNLEKLNPKDCVFHIVSKSGTTAETIGIFSIILNWFQKMGIQESEYNQHLIFSTDPKAGDLRELAEKWSVKTLAIPTDVGGRFSVLTSVGLFPALFLGLNLETMLSSAKTTAKSLLADKDFANLCQYILNEKNKGVTNTVVMPYSSRLKTLGQWFVQLWAESLGKKKNLENETVYEGLTPIASYGATDQHSQMQLFVEGPKDKFILFIKTQDHKAKGSMSSSLKLNSFKKLAPFDMEQLIHNQLLGTLKVFELEKRPFALIEIDQINEATLCELIVFFEILTVVVGDALQINPFDQPGVEAGKRYAFEFLEKSR